MYKLRIMKNKKMKNKKIKASFHIPTAADRIRIRPNSEVEFMLNLCRVRFNY